MEERKKKKRGVIRGKGRVVKKDFSLGKDLKGRRKNSGRLARKEIRRKGKGNEKRERKKEGRKVREEISREEKRKRKGREKGRKGRKKVKEGEFFKQIFD